MNSSWITFAWSSSAAACLTLAFVHLVIWVRQPARRAHLVFVILAASVAAVAVFELLMMRAQTPIEFGEIERWRQIPIFTLVVSVVLYVRLYFGAGNLWLAGITCGLRLLALVINFLAETNLHYARITALREVPLLGGETASVAVGTLGPWLWIGQLSSLFLVMFITSASIALWRRGGRDERRRAALVGGSFGVFIAVAAGLQALINAGVIDIPNVLSLCFLMIVAATSFELGTDVLRSEQFAEQLKGTEAALRLNQQRVEHAADAAQTGIWEWDMTRNELWVTDEFRRLFGIDARGRLSIASVIDKVH